MVRGKVKTQVSDVVVILEKPTRRHLNLKEGTIQDPYYLRQTKSITFSRNLFHRHTLKEHKDTLGQMSCSPLCDVVTLHYGQTASIM